ncbi:MAG: hypothetical protein ACMUHY_02465 [Thermoplasmatota archaeon]
MGRWSSLIDQPAVLALILMLAGISILLLSIHNLPVPNGPDRDSDGISDTFQSIDPVQDVIRDGDGWQVVTVGYTTDMDLTFLISAGGVLIVVVPLSGAYWSWNRPRRKERERSWRQEGRMHDVVRRISAFLEINPSLPAAVKLTRTSLPQSEQSILGELVWSPFASGRSFDVVYGDFCERWSARSPVIGRALKSLGNVERESTEMEVVISARALVARLSEESKALMEGYSRSLSGPATALFGIGVLLPILLATMIPVAGVSGRTAVMIGFVLWIVLPAGILHMGSSLVLKRPCLGEGIDAEGPGKFSPGLLDIVLVIVGALLLLSIPMGVISVTGVPAGIAGGGSASAYVLISMLGASFILAGVVGAVTRISRRSLLGYLAVRDRSPLLLRKLSTFLMEGHSFEFSLKRMLRGEKVGTGMEHRPLPGTRLRDGRIPEPLLSYLESSMEFSKAGRGPGGRAVRAFSKHIQELQDLERDLSSRIRSAVGQMEITSSIFAPLMIGASAGIFSLMGSVKGEAPSGMLFGGASSGTIESWHFLLISAVYLLMLSITTTLTIYRLENGTTKGGWHKVPPRLIQSSVAFTAGVMASSFMIG